jgi:hypothetical protein
MAKQAKKAVGDKPKRGRKSNAEKAAAKAAAEQSRPEAQPQPSPASAGGGSVIKLPTAGVVPKLVKSLESMAGDIRQTTSEMGERVAKAVENQHVDKTALRWIRMVVKKMASQPKAGALSYNHFLYYLEELKISDLADAALGMDLGEGEQAETADDAHASATAAEAGTTEAEWNAAAPAKPGLSIVPGPNAPSEVPPAPGDDTEQAA